MTQQEFLIQRVELRKYYDEKLNDLCTEYMKSRQSFQIGEVISDGEKYIKIVAITITAPHTELPSFIYWGYPVSETGELETPEDINQRIQIQETNVTTPLP